MKVCLVPLRNMNLVSSKKKLVLKNPMVRSPCTSNEGK